jgi:hypothetical protein
VDLVVGDRRMHKSRISHHSESLSKRVVFERKPAERISARSDLKSAPGNRVRVRGPAARTNNFKSSRGKLLRWFVCRILPCNHHATSRARQSAEWQNSHCTARKRRAAPRSTTAPICVTPSPNSASGLSRLSNAPLTRPDFNCCHGDGSSNERSLGSIETAVWPRILPPLCGRARRA